MVWHVGSDDDDEFESSTIMNDVCTLSLRSSTMLFKGPPVLS